MEWIIFSLCLASVAIASVLLLRFGSVYAGLKAAHDALALDLDEAHKHLVSLEKRISKEVKEFADDTKHYVGMGKNAMADAVDAVVGEERSVTAAGAQVPAAHSAAPKSNMDGALMRLAALESTAKGTDVAVGQLLQLAQRIVAQQEAQSSDMNSMRNAFADINERLDKLESDDLGMADVRSDMAIFERMLTEGGSHLSQMQQRLDGAVKTLTDTNAMVSEVVKQNSGYVNLADQLLKQANAISAVVQACDALQSQISQEAATRLEETRSLGAGLDNVARSVELLTKLFTQRVHIPITVADTPAAANN